MSSLVPCPSCHRHVAEATQACPFCGGPMSDAEKARPSGHSQTALAAAAGFQGGVEEGPAVPEEKK